MIPRSWRQKPWSKYVRASTLSPRAVQHRWTTALQWAWAKLFSTWRNNDTFYCLRIRCDNEVCRAQASYENVTLIMSILRSSMAVFWGWGWWFDTLSKGTGMTTNCSIEINRCVWGDKGCCWKVQNQSNIINKAWKKEVNVMTLLSLAALGG